MEKLKQIENTRKDFSQKMTPICKASPAAVAAANKGPRAKDFLKKNSASQQGELVASSLFICKSCTKQLSHDFRLCEKIEICATKWARSEKVSFKHGWIVWCIMTNFYYRPSSLTVSQQASANGLRRDNKTARKTWEMGNKQTNSSEVAVWQMAKRPSTAAKEEMDAFAHSIQIIQRALV